MGKHIKHKNVRRNEPENRRATEDSESKLKARQKKCRPSRWCQSHSENQALYQADQHIWRSETTITATTLAASGIGWSWGNILDSANLHAGTSESTESGLSTWAWGLGTVTSSGADFDVKSVDAQLLAASSDILSSQHSGVWGGLVTVCLDLHSTGDTGDGFAATEISDVDECVVERGKDTGYAKDELSISDLGAEGDVLLGGSCGFLWWHFGRCGIELSSHVLCPC